MTEERRDLEEEARIQRVLRQRPRDLSIPSFTAVETRLRRRTPVPVVLATSAAAILLALILGTAVAERRAATPAASPSPAQSAAPATASTAPEESRTPTASATTSFLSDRFGFVWVDEPRGLLRVRPEAGGSESTIVARPYGFNDCGCRVSPDGTRIAYWINRATPENVELRVVDLSRPTQPTTIYTAPSAQRISGAAWSSDGTGILLAVEGVSPPGSPPGSPPHPALLAIEVGGGAPRTLDTDAGVYVPLGWDKTAGIAAAALSGEGGYMFGYVTVRTSGDPMPRRTAVSEDVYVESVEVSSDQRYALGVFFERGQTGGTVRWWRLADFAPTTTGGPILAGQFGAKWRPGTAEIGWALGRELQLLDIERGATRVAGPLPAGGYAIAAFRYDGSAVVVTTASGSSKLLLDLTSGASETISGPGYVAEAVRMPAPPPALPIATPEPGAITGTYAIGSEYDPAVTVYAISTTNPSLWYSVTVPGYYGPHPTPPPGTTGGEYSITGVAPGTYWVVAYSDEPEGQLPYPGWYSRQNDCFRSNPSGPCPDITMIPVTVRAGEVTSGINLNTWFEPPEAPPTVPPRPTPRPR